MVGGVLPNNSTFMPSALLTDVTSTDENFPEQIEEQSGAPPLTDDEEEIYQSSDEEEDEEVESLVPDIPDQTILAILIEGKTPHQKCDECSIPKEECETNAAVAEVTWSPSERTNSSSLDFISISSHHWQPYPIGSAPTLTTPILPDQTILASLIEGKTLHQKCDECSIPKEECETIAAVAEVTEEEEDKVSTIFVSLDLSTKEKELCEEKINQIKSKLILHPENKSRMKSSQVTICLAKVRKKDEANFTKNVQEAITNYYKQSRFNPISFRNPTMFKKEGQVITLNLEPTGEDKQFLTGLHQHLLTTICNQIQQDLHHTYNPQITMFTTKPKLPLPDLLPEELQL